MVPYRTYRHSTGPYPFVKRRSTFPHSVLRLSTGLSPCHLTRHWSQPAVLASHWSHSQWSDISLVPHTFCVLTSHWSLSKCSLIYHCSLLLCSSTSRCSHCQWSDTPLVWIRVFWHPTGPSSCVPLIPSPVFGYPFGPIQCVLTFLWSHTLCPGWQAISPVLVVWHPTDPTSWSHGITWWGCCQRQKPTKLARSFLFCSCVYFCFCGPYNCTLFHKLFRQLSGFSLCSSGLIFCLNGPFNSTSL